MQINIRRGSLYGRPVKYWPGLPFTTLKYCRFHNDISSPTFVREIFDRSTDPHGGPPGIRNRNFMCQKTKFKVKMIKICVYMFMMTKITRDLFVIP